MDSIDLFVKNWSNAKTMAPINVSDLLELENKLNITLPQSYKYLISTYGLVHTPNVFSKIIDLNSNITEVQDFLSLDDVFSLSKLYEMSGMPKGHIVIASDAKGNMFCFKTSECQNSQPDPAIWFYDHGTGSIEKVSNSFSQWLESFNQLQNS